MIQKAVKQLTIDELSNIPIDVYRELLIPKYLRKYTNICNIMRDNGGSCDTNTIILGLFNKYQEKVRRVPLQKTLAVMRERGYIEFTEVKGIYRLVKK